MLRVWSGSGRARQRRRGGVGAGVGHQADRAGEGSTMYCRGGAAAVREADHRCRTVRVGGVGRAPTSTPRRSCCPRRAMCPSRPPPLIAALLGVPVSTGFVARAHERFADLLSAGGLDEAMVAALRARRCSAATSPRSTWSTTSTATGSRRRCPARGHGTHPAGDCLVQGVLRPHLRADRGAGHLRQLARHPRARRLRRLAPSSTPPWPAYSNELVRGSSLQTDGP